MINLYYKFIYLYLHLHLFTIINYTSKLDLQITYQKPKSISDNNYKKFWISVISNLNIKINLQHNKKEVINKINNY